MIGLTPRQADCLAAIKRLNAEGISPTRTQLCAAMGISSRGALQKFLDGLVERGHIEIIPRTRHNIRLIDGDA